MKNNNSAKATPSLNDIPQDALRLAFSIRLQGGDEIACDFSSYIEIPMGVHPNHLNSTYLAIGDLFEHCIKKPTMISARGLIASRAEKARKEASEKEVVTPESTVAPQPSIESGLESASEELERIAAWDQGDEIPVPPSMRGTLAASSPDPGPPYPKASSMFNLKQAA